MSDTITSRPFHPKMACERCCFGSGEHAEWCERKDTTPFLCPDCNSPFTTYGFNEWWCLDCRHGGPRGPRT